MLEQKKQQYNEILKRIDKAEKLLTNIDILRKLGKVDKSDAFYQQAYRQVIDKLNLARVEVEKELDRKMTAKEILKGF